MTIAAKEATSLIAFTLPSTRYSAWMARYHVRAALKRHDLYDYADDAATVTSELAANAIMHAGAPKFDVEVMRLAGLEAIAVIVTDSSPEPPVKRDPAGDTEHGRGLHIVEALSSSWGWRPEHPGKAVYAILTREA